MHLRVWKEVANVIARQVSIIFESQWQSGAIPEHFKKSNSTPTGLASLS